jgi:hypothetical protein
LLLLIFKYIQNKKNKRVSLGIVSLFLNEIFHEKLNRQVNINYKRIVLSDFYSSVLRKPKVLEETNSDRESQAACSRAIAQGLMGPTRTHGSNKDSWVQWEFDPNIKGYRQEKEMNDLVKTFFLNIYRLCQEEEPFPFRTHLLNKSYLRMYFPSNICSPPLSFQG